MLLVDYGAMEGWSVYRYETRAELVREIMSGAGNGRPTLCAKELYVSVFEDREEGYESESV